MQHLEGSGTPVLYIGRSVLKVCVLKTGLQATRRVAARALYKLMTELSFTKNLTCRMH